MVGYCLLHKCYLKNHQIYSKCTKEQRTKSGKIKPKCQHLVILERKLDEKT